MRNFAYSFVFKMKIRSKQFIIFEAVALIVPFLITHVYFLMLFLNSSEFALREEMITDLGDCVVSGFLSSLVFAIPAAISWKFWNGRKWVILSLWLLATIVLFWLIPLLLFRE